jgi:hypothetical protein
MPGIPLGPSALIEAADWTRTRLAAFKVPQPAGNRLIRAQLLIRQVNDGTITLRIDDEDILTRVTDAQWTILEQYIVTRALGRPGHQLRRTQLAKLETMLSGADTDELDRNPLARNTQFELYAGATLKMGDVHARLAEPDLRIDYLGQEIGIAAKRVRSSKQFLRRAKEAADQIAESGSPGIVAMNVDVLLRATAADVSGNEQLHDRLIVIKEMDDVLSGEPGVVGSLVFARDSVWQFGGQRPSVGLASTHRFAVYPRSQRQAENGESFWQQVQQRIDDRMATL